MSVVSFGERFKHHWSDDRWGGTAIGWVEPNKEPISATFDFLAEALLDF